MAGVRTRNRPWATEGDAVPRRRFTVDEYERMIAAGIIAEGERVELLEGEIVTMASMGSVHAACVDRTNQMFTLRTVGRAQVRVQCPIRLPPHSEPEPDVALLLPHADFYAAGHPGPAAVLLMVEVAHRTLAANRRRKVPLYARAGIREVWLVDIEARRVEVFRAPQGGRYRERTVHGPDDWLSPLAFPDLRLRAVELLGESTTG
jgi:Uma2 family endonuclease